MTLFARADTLVGTNDERFVGQVVSESTNAIVFNSELGGLVTIPRARVRELQRSSTNKINSTADSILSATNPPANPSPANLDWRPPGIGQDGHDWIQLKSGEWLKGDIKYIQQKKVEFDSDELEEMTLKLKDVRQAYTAHRVFTKFNDRPAAYGTVVISNDVITVNGAEPISMPRDELTGITPGESELDLWSGNIVVGVNYQSGNSRQTTISSSAEVARRTPNTWLLLNYLGNYTEVNDSRTENNQRFNTSYDIRINRDWFVRPVLMEFYHDPLANIELRATGGTALGYYISDRDDFEWRIGAGPGYQYTRFDNVEPGRSHTATTPAGVFQSYVKLDLTRRLTFYQSWQSMVMDHEAGDYTHHTVTTLEFEIKRHLDLDVSFIWDYLHNPQPKSDGDTPYKSDFYLTVGLGVRF
jgi:hypothetical protein